MENSNNNFAIIVAGGSGSRFGATIPKQFVCIQEIPILVHTIHQFLKAAIQLPIVLVLPSTELERWDQIATKFSLTDKVNIVIGGATRMESVQNGLNAINNSGTVGIHDGARPLVSADLINTCFQKAREFSNAIPAIECPDSVRRMRTAEDSEIINRTELRLVQTPQCFDVFKLKQAFALASTTDFSDDASVWEAAGNKVHLINGERLNIKITTQEDCTFAEKFLTT
jgi:2-C-methyl-D-erythritol 4-phosphate cytidylyltransferase